MQLSWLSLMVTTELGESEPAKRSAASTSNTHFFTVTMYGTQFAATSNEGPCTTMQPPPPTRPFSNEHVAGRPTDGRWVPHSVRRHFGATAQPRPVWVAPACVQFTCRSLSMEPEQ